MQNWTKQNNEFFLNWREKILNCIVYEQTTSIRYCKWFLSITACNLCYNLESNIWNKLLLEDWIVGLKVSATKKSLRDWHMTKTLIKREYKPIAIISTDK